MTNTITETLSAISAASMPTVESGGEKVARAFERNMYTVECPKNSGRYKRVYEITWSDGSKRFCVM